MEHIILYYINTEFTVKGEVPKLIWISRTPYFLQYYISYYKVPMIKPNLGI